MRRDLLIGMIVDEVFDGAIEDARVIEEIYDVIYRENIEHLISSRDLFMAHNRELAEKLAYLESKVRRLEDRATNAERKYRALVKAEKAAKEYLELRQQRQRELCDE